MKKFRVFLLTFLLVFLVACGSSNNTVSQESYDTTADYESVESSSEEAEEAVETSRNTSPENRKIIVNYSFYFDTSEYNTSIEEINKYVNENNGYHSSGEESTTGVKSSTMVVHIPRENVDKFINEITNIEDLNLVNKQLSSEDVTEMYTDTNLRLTSLQEKLERLYALQENQSDLDQLLALEREISETIFEIERLQGQINSIDSKVDYTQIQINVNEIGLSSTTQTTVKFGDRVSRAFSDSIKNFSNTIGDLIIGFIYLLPLLIVILIIALIVRYFAKKFPKKERDFDFIKNRRRSKKSDEDKLKNLDDK